MAGPLGPGGGRCGPAVPTGPGRPSTSGWHVPWAVASTAVVGAALTVVLAFAPTVAASPPLPDARAVLETALVVISSLIGILTWGRYRLRRQRVDLALAGVVTFAWVLRPVWALAGTALSGHNGSVWAPTGARLLGALTLALASSWPAGRYHYGRQRPRRLSAWGAGRVAAIGACGATGVLGFTVLFGHVPAPTTTVSPAGSFGDWPLFESLEVLSAAALFVAAGALAGQAGAVVDRFATWVGLACALDALASVNYAVFPSVSTPWLYTGDYFRVAAIGAWAVAGYHEITRYQHETARLARLAERSRIARDLHDGLAQDLAYLSSRAKLLLSSATADYASLLDIATTSERALQESRRAVLSLTRPTSVPLDADLVRTASEAARGYPTRVRVFVDPDVAVGPDRREALVSIVREAVHNASRHGRASTATVEVSRSNGGMVLRVSDDGAGFDPAGTWGPREVPRRSGFGLLGMQERSRAAGGRFVLSSSPGSGTTVEVEWS